MPTEEPVANWYMLRIWLKMAVESGHLATLPPQYSSDNSQVPQPTERYARQLIDELKDPERSFRLLSEILDDAQRFGEWIQRCSRTPATCPVCGSDQIKRILWKWVCLLPKDTSDVDAGRAILAGRCRATMRQGQRATDDAEGTLVAPKWACLQCEPSWAEVHRLVVSEMELEMEKEKAIQLQDWERAASWLNRQNRLRDRIFELVKGLNGGPAWRLG
jgi:hypothetical protein